MNGRDVRLLHTSDWHLGAPIHWGPDKQAAQDWIPIVRRDREAAIDAVIRVACTNRVDAVLVAGDILDQPNLSPAVRKRSEDFLR
jgi:DNA repair exonuclease SbcCD nuclease subunit